MGMQPGHPWHDLQPMAMALLGPTGEEAPAPHTAPPPQERASATAMAHMGLLLPSKQAMLCPGWATIVVLACWAVSVCLGQPQGTTSP